MFFLVTLICQKCGLEKEGFRGNVEQCPNCKTTLIEDTMQNHKIEGVRGFRHADKRDNK